MKDRVIVTGASSNHFSCLKNLLLSLSVFEGGTRVIVFDLGLEPHEVSVLKGTSCEIRRFPYEEYPSFVDIRVNFGCYAWKPILLANLIEELEGTLLWLDAGNIVRRPLGAFWEAIVSHGIYSPRSRGTITEWTHRGTLEYLNVPPEIMVRRNRNAAIVGLHAARPQIRELVREWRRFALDIRCIAPEGANLLNHRYDQAVLSILMYQFAASYQLTLLSGIRGITTHHDKESSAKIRKMLGLMPEPVELNSSPD